MSLAPSAVTAGFRLAAHETLTSTNSEALALARRGEKSPIWITARRQTAGRGRRGSAWDSPPGNLHATLLLIDPAPVEHAPEISFVAALAVHDAIADRAAALRNKLELKWPNDILCAGRKLAGILIEGESVDPESAIRLAVAVGIGVNCRHHPAQASFPATDLAVCGADMSAEALFTALSETTLRRLAQWRCGAGFAGIRADWLDRAAGIGGEIRVRLPSHELNGRFEALDERGRLLLRLAGGGLQTIAAGDVFPVASREHSSQQWSAE